MANLYKAYASRYYDVNTGTIIAGEIELYEELLIDPKVTGGMGKSGSFEFSMYPEGKHFSIFRKMKTVVRVTYDGADIFYGRVLTIDDDPVQGTRKVHCEGALAYLLDSQQAAVKDEDKVEMTLANYVYKVINEHNRQMSAENPEKVFTLRKYPGHYTSDYDQEQQIENKTEKYESSSWQNTSDALESLQNTQGGYFRAEYQAANGKLYLDWLNYYFNPIINAQEIRIGENLISQSENANTNNIFTVLIPIGSGKGQSIYLDGYRTDIHGDNNYIRVPDICKVYTQAQLNQGFHAYSEYAQAIEKHGIIYKTVSFSGADSQEKLWELATAYIKENYMGGVTSFSITALDLRNINSSYQKIMVGDRIRVIYPDMEDLGNEISKVLVCTNATYYLNNPEKNEYTIEIPDCAMRSLTEKRNKGGSKTDQDANNLPGGGGGWGGGGGDDPYAALAWRYVIDAGHNTEEFQELIDKYGENSWEVAAAQKVSYLAIKDILEVPDDVGPEEEWRVNHRALKRYNTIVFDGHEREISVAGPINPMWSEEAKDTAAAARALSIKIDEQNGYIQLKKWFKYDGTSAEVMKDATSMETRTAVNWWRITQYMEGHGAESNDPVESTVVDGLTGLFMGQGADYGLDGSGKKTTVKINGKVGSQEYYQLLENQLIGKNPSIIMSGQDGTGTFKNDLVLQDDGVTGEIHLRQKIKATDENITIALEFVDKAGNLLRQTGLGVDASGSLIYNWDQETDGGLQSVIGDIIQGSALATTWNELDAVSGVFHVVQTDPNDPTKTKIVIDEGSGMFLRRDGAEYGMYDDGNLTAGVIVGKFQNDAGNQKTFAELLADYVNITGSQITINATEAASLGIVTVGKDGTTNLDAGLVVSALNDGTITKGEKETVASLFGDYVNITANHIAKFGLVSTNANQDGTTKLAAGLVVSALNDGTITNTEKQTVANLFASKISITASQVADFGASAQNEAGKLVTAKFIADTLNGGTATIQAKNLALDGVEVIDMINSTTVKVNAANVDLSGYLTAAQIRSGYIAAGTIDSTYINNEIGKLDNVTMKKATISGSLVMGDATLTTAQAPDILRGIKVVANGSTGYKLQGVTLGNPNWHDLANSSFDKAATISGSWGSGVFTVSATAGSTNTVRTSLTNTGHWGVAANGEDVNKYYYSTKATIGTSGTVYDTGNATIIDATTRYNTGWNNCYNDVSLSKTGTLHLAGGVEYIVYPTGKQTPSGATQSITGKALTIITDSDWNEALATVELYPSYVPTLSPGQTKTIEVRARLDKQSSSLVTVRSITVQAASITPATAAVSGWTYYSSFPGGQEAGTANSNGYYQFRVGDTARYFVYVNVPSSSVDPGPIGDAKLAYDTASHRVYVSAYGNQTSYTITETCDINWDSSSKQFYATGIATIGNNITMAQQTRYTDALRFVTSDSVVSVYMGSTQLMSVTHTAASSVTGKLLLNTSTHKVSVSSSSSATATEYIVTAEVSSLEWDASTKQFIATSIAKVGGTKMADSAEKRSTALSIDTTSSTTKVYLKQGSATLITADHTAGTAAARITYNTSNGTVYATTSGSTTSYAVGLTASTATWDATNSRYNLPVSALLDTSITIKSRTFSLPTLTLDTTSSTTQVYLKEGTTTRLTANHVAAGWAQYYNKKEWWSIATSQTNWYAYTPKEDASGSEKWDCGARTAYTTGARTCFMGIGSAGTDICGTTRNIAPGDTLEVWAGGYDIDGNKVWNSKSVKFHSTAINGVPWIGGSDNKPVSDFKVEYNKSVDIWPAITAEDGAVGWGNKITVSGPTSTITWGTPKATRSSSYSGTFISNIIATKDQYITIQVFANNVPKTYYIKMV